MAIGLSPSGNMITQAICDALLYAVILTAGIMIGLIVSRIDPWK